MGCHSVVRAIPYGHASVSGQVFNVSLGKAAELDAVIHAAENASRCPQWTHHAHLRAIGMKGE